LNIKKNQNAYTLPGSFFYFFVGSLLFQLKNQQSTPMIYDFNKALSLFNDMQYASLQKLFLKKKRQN
jgi:hypothetical protein